MPGDGDAVLFFTSGEQERLRRKCCYFLRTKDGPVSPSVGCDDELLFGELSADPLRVLESCISRLYMPNFEGTNEWGKASEDHRDEFMTGLNKFLVRLAL